MAAQVFKVQPKKPAPQPIEYPKLPTKTWSYVWFSILQTWAALILACLLCPLPIALLTWYEHVNSTTLGLEILRLILCAPYIGCFVHTIYTLAVLISWCQSKRES